MTDQFSSLPSADMESNAGTEILSEGSNNAAGTSSSKKKFVNLRQKVKLLSQVTHFTSQTQLSQIRRQNNQAGIDIYHPPVSVKNRIASRPFHSSKLIHTNDRNLRKSLSLTMMQMICHQRN